MEDKKKDSIDAEVNEVKEVKTESAPAKKEEEKRAFDQANLTRSIIYAAIITALYTTHSILGTFVSGNVPWFILNLIFTVCAVVVALLAGLFFFKVTKDNLKNDIPSFAVSLAAFGVSTLCALIWSIDMIRNFVGMFQ